MLSEINEPGPGFEYFLNTPCQDWDAVQYHEALRANNFGLNEETVTKSFNEQLLHIKEQGTEEEKKNAIRLENQFKLESRKTGQIDNFWLKHLPELKPNNFMENGKINAENVFLSCDLFCYGVQFSGTDNIIQGHKRPYENHKQLNVEEGIPAKRMSSVSLSSRDGHSISHIRDERYDDWRRSSKSRGRSRSKDNTNPSGSSRNINQSFGRSDRTDKSCVRGEWYIRSPNRSSHERGEGYIRSPRNNHERSEQYIRCPSRDNYERNEQYIRSPSRRNHARSEYIRSPSRNNHERNEEYIRSPSRNSRGSREQYIRSPGRINHVRNERYIRSPSRINHVRSERYIRSPSRINHVRSERYIRSPSKNNNVRSEEYIRSPSRDNHEKNDQYIRSPSRNGHRRSEQYIRSPGRSHYRSLSRSFGRHRNSVVPIQSTLNYLIDEVHSLKQTSLQTPSSTSGNATLSNRNRSESLTVEQSGGSSQKSQKSRVALEEMTEQQFKSFRSEVIQILASFDDSLSLDHTQPWNDISNHVLKKIMPAIGKIIDKRISYNHTELKYVLKQLHNHRRENWKISQDATKAKADKKRKGTNSRRFEKKERRKRGIEHMFNTNDKVLTYSKPSNLPREEYKKDIEEIVANGDYHSDEVSETDNEMVQEEISKNIRPKNKKESDMHVIRVYDKPWRSQRIKKILRHADSVSDAIQHTKIQRKRWYNDNLFKDNSIPPDNVPRWVILTSYHSNEGEEKKEEMQEEKVEINNE